MLSPLFFPPHFGPASRGKDSTKWFIRLNDCFWKVFFFCCINVLSWILIHGGGDSLYAVRPPQLCSSWSGHQSRQLRCNCCKGIKINNGDWNRVFCQKMSVPRWEKGSGKLMVLHWLMWPCHWLTTDKLHWSTVHCRGESWYVYLLVSHAFVDKTKAFHSKKKKGFPYISCLCFKCHLSNVRLTKLSIILQITMI